MFDSLKLLPPADAAPPRNRRRATLIARTNLSMLQTMLNQTTALSRVQAHLRDMSNTMHDFSDLRLLRTTVHEHGLNRSLLAFANPKNNGVSRVVRDIPAIETLDGVAIGVTDARVISALEGMDETLDTEPGLVADWIRTGADNVDTMLTNTEQHMKGLGGAISHYLEELEEASISDDSLAGCTIQAMSHDAVMSCIMSLLEVLPDLDAKVSDPTDRDAMDAHQTKLASLADNLGEHTGLSVDDSNPHQLEVGEPAQTSQPFSGTLVELGYTCENVIELLKRADSLVDEVVGLVQRKEEMVGHLNDAAVMVEALDNDVPPAVDDAIPEEGAEASVDDGIVTQVDVVHCHVSSHVCCIASVIEAACCAVQNVLRIANCLDELDANDPMSDDVEDDGTTD